MSKTYYLSLLPVEEITMEFMGDKTVVEVSQIEDNAKMMFLAYDNRGDAEANNREVYEITLKEDNDA